MISTHAQLEEERRNLQDKRAKLQEQWSNLKAEKLLFNKERNDSGMEFKLFFGNLDDMSGEDDIRNFCSPYGSLKEVVMLKDNNTGKSKRSCFVKYYAQAAADACVEALNGKIRDKNSTQMLCVRYANQRQQPGMMGGAPPMGGAPMGGGMMSNYAVPATNAYNPYPAAVANPAPGYGGAASYGADQRAYTGYDASGYGPVKAVGTNGSSLSSGSGRGPPGSNLYVNNLAPNSSETDVTNMFADFGTVLSVKIFPNNNYGFVSFDNPQSAQYAMTSLNGLNIGDSHRQLEVTLKKEGGGGGRSSRFAPY